MQRRSQEGDNPFRPAAPAEKDRIPRLDVRVALIVANEVVRRGMQAVLGSLPGVVTVASGASSSRGAPAAADAAEVVIVSTAPHDLTAARELAWLTPRPKVLILLADPTERDTVISAGAPVDGFLYQVEASAESLHEALSRTRDGEVPMPAGVARDLLARAGAPAPTPRPAALTGRENETLLLLVEGLSNKQIARRLAISDHGAKRLVGSVLVKLDSPNRTTAVVTAIRGGLIHPT